MFIEIKIAASSRNRCTKEKRWKTEVNNALSVCVTLFRFSYNYLFTAATHTYTVQFYKYEDVEGEGKNRNQAWENIEEKGLKERRNNIMMEMQNCYNISL